MALNLAVKEVMYLRDLLGELGIPPTGPTPVFCDNQATVAISKDPVCTSRTRHVSTYFHWVREQQGKGVISKIPISTNEQAADYLTKMLPTAEFRANCALVGQVMLTSEAAGVPKEGECCDEDLGSAARAAATATTKRLPRDRREVGKTPTGSQLFGRTTWALKGSFGNTATRLFHQQRPGIHLQKCRMTIRHKSRPKGDLKDNQAHVEQYIGPDGETRLGEQQNEALCITLVKESVGDQSLRRIHRQRQEATTGMG